jgi:hypothetical protein
MNRVNLFNSSFENPFKGINANGIDDNEMLKYWHSPFKTFIKEYSEDYIFNDLQSIVFMGGRGTGKTMILRYFSYDVQKLESKKLNENLIEHMQKIKSLGFYIRFGLELKSFEGFEYPQEKWKIIFIHYFELSICSKYINVLIDLEKNNQICTQTVNTLLIPALKQTLGCDNTEYISLFDVKTILNNRLMEINKFREDIVFHNAEFKPVKLFKEKDLSFEVVRLIKKYIPALSTVTFLILLDEYENFREWQQSLINTMMKYLDKEIKVTFRIGMRLSGFHTYETISKEEFLKPNRDYQQIVIEDFVHRGKNKHEYQKYLEQISEKRLSSVEVFRDKKLTDIKKFLGKTENYEEEAFEIVKGDTEKHFKELLDVYDEKLLDFIKYPNNPLLEMLNILWLNRKRETPEIIQEAMLQFLEKNFQSEVARKYKKDYTDKYKLSLLFNLLSVYKAKKKYYSFNTFSYLSSGVVMYFIELCRETFEIAYFEDRESLLEGKPINKSIQSKSAMNVANSELEAVKTIEDYGSRLYNLVENLGNIFRVIHQDKYCKYPETNQFSFKSTIEDIELNKVLNAAQRWTVVQKKKELQQRSIGKTKGEIFTLNRVYSPAFQISYRTRGGYCEEYDQDDFKKLLYEKGVRPKAFSKVRNSINKERKKTDDGQIILLDH